MQMRIVMSSYWIAFGLPMFLMPFARAQESPPAPTFTVPAGGQLRGGQGTTPVQTADSDASLNAMIGKPAPAFQLPDQNDKPVSLAASKGKWVVVAFYPADMTRGCTFQNISYSKNKDKFAPLNAVVYTISTQDTESKRAFCSKEGLQNILLSDVGGKVATAYNVLRPNNLARRVTFYITPEGTIAAIDTRPNVQKAAEDSLTKLKALSAARTDNKTTPQTPKTR